MGAAMRFHNSSILSLPVAMAALGILFATPAFGDSIHDKTDAKAAEIPTCTHKLGTLAVKEPDNNWWGGLGLESPEALIKVFVMKSGCFTLLDRGRGFQAAQQERELASGGELQGGSNIGKGQVKAADYVMIPDIVSKNNDSSGSNIGGLVGGFFGHGAGALLGGLSISSKTADVVLTITNVRTSEQQAMEEGHGSKRDIGFSMGAGWGGWGGFGGAGISNYQNTAIGQVVVLAYIDAYTKLVGDLGGLSASASADAPTQAITMMKPGRMYTHASLKSKVVRTLDAGMMLYPTGNKEGVWWEVKDELGNLGWVSSLLVSLSK
jgi:curli biogenesis system outer membrane secretion channel CsgG